MNIPRLSTAHRNAMTLTNADKGLMVFDTDLNLTHTWNGSTWLNGSTATTAVTATTALNAQKLIFPYKDSLLLTAPTNTRLFTLKYNGTSDVGVTQFQNLYTGNLRPVVSTLQRGLGYAGTFVVDNVNNDASALYVETNTGVDYSPAFLAFSVGTASTAGAFYTTDASNPSSTLYSETGGQGNAATFKNTNSSNSVPTLYSETNGVGEAGFFRIANSSNSGATLYSETDGVGGAGFFKIANPSSSAASVYSETNTSGSGAAFWGRNLGSSGYAAFLDSTDPSNAQPVLLSRGAGTGPAGRFNQIGAAGNIVEFQSASANVARITTSGMGIFNGGTQTGGADLAELFDVEGNKTEYEPGDVLVISESTDRTVEKSSSPNSTKVAGVYATKPGVTLTEKDINQSIDELVPMGVIGVIPTKVCHENGVIMRGDLLVTSSRPGHAMKAVSLKGDGVFPSGVIIGKALENFYGASGTIKVLVNVK